METRIVDAEVVRRKLVDADILDRPPRDRPCDAEGRPHRCTSQGERSPVIRADHREVVASLTDCHRYRVGAGAVGEDACVGS
jgi:hypothetical protein